MTTFDSKRFLRSRFSNVDSHSSPGSTVSFTSVNLLRKVLAQLDDDDFRSSQLKTKITKTRINPIFLVIFFFIDRFDLFKKKMFTVELFSVANQILNF